MRSVTTTGRLLGARQLATIVQRVADRQGEWLSRVRLNPAGRWYEQITLDDSHEVWLISWLPGQETGFHDHGGASGAFTVALGTLLESRPGLAGTSQVLAKPVGAGGVRSFGPRYIHNVRNASAASVAVSVHAYSPPLSAMTRYEMTQSGLATLGTEAATAWSAA
jgi:predicted metal-dependent enzyme (double-stranded beta helix superfamily)